MKYFGATEYLATAETALRIYGRVWFASHVKCPTNDRKGSSTSGSSLSNSWSFRSTIIGVLLPRVTPDVDTRPPAKPCCNMVNVPASRSRENRQPAYYRNSPRLLIGTYSSQILSHLLLSPIAKISSTCTTTTIETAPSSTKRKTHASA